MFTMEKTYVCVLALLLALTVVTAFDFKVQMNGGNKKTTKMNDRPIIGILAIDTDSQYGTTMISATYVKYLEQAGARVVPIRGGQPENYYKQMANWTNGLLMPGGAVNFATSLMGRSAKMMYERAIEVNMGGGYYPLWGTCMGFQLLCYLVQGENMLKPTDSDNVSWPLNFTSDYRKSRLYGSAPQEIIDILSTEPVTQNQHSYSILTEVFDGPTSKLKTFFKKLSTNDDRKGVEFVSSVEAIGFPFYGVQWHPEKPNFNWNPNYDINHSPDAIKVSQYMANFFVNEARKSSHRFPSVAEESANMIQNYGHHYYDDGSFFDIYYFDPKK